MTDQLPAPAPSLAELLASRARLHPDRLACTFLDGALRETATLSYAEVDRGARRVARLLDQRGICIGDRVVLALDTGPEFVLGLFGCFYRGAIAVPARPLPNHRQIERPDERLAAILSDSEPAAIMIPDCPAPDDVDERRCLRLSDVARQMPGEHGPVSLAGDAAAVLQYTSGSTRQPRGVIVTRASLIANQLSISAACRHDARTVFVGWAPLFHDLGLVANLLQPLYLGGHSVLMSATAFLRRPVSWLRAIDRYRATTSGGPDFAYALCADKIGQDELSGLDLSCWRVAFTSAEPVRAATLTAFGALCKPAGFDPSAWLPCYGLAENTLLATQWADPRHQQPVVPGFDPGELSRGRAVRTGKATARRLVSCGVPAPATEITVVSVRARTDRDGRCCAEPVPDGTVGEIWLRGESVATGYWGRPRETRTVFGCRTPDGRTWLASGDLGFVDDGQLYLTGRVNDVIVVRGENHFPSDLEATVAADPALASARSIAFGHAPHDGPEGVVLVVAVVRRDELGDGRVHAQRLRGALSREHGVAPSTVVFVRRGTLPMTSSGKPRRARCRELWLAGELAVLAQVDFAGQAGFALPAREDLDRLPPDDRRAAARQGLIETVAAHAGIPVEALDPTESIACAGLDSLAAQQLQLAIELTWSIRLRTGELLAPGAIGAVADLLLPPLPGPVGSSARAGSVGAPSARTPRTGRGLTAAEASIWIEDRAAPGGTAYCLTRVVSDEQAERRFDPRALRRALAALLAAHPALASVVVLGDDGSPRLTSAPRRPALTVLDVESGAAQTGAVVALARRGLDLLTEPAFRLTLVRSARASHLVLTAHHLVVDNTAAITVLRDLALAYQGNVLRGQDLAPGEPADPAPDEPAGQDADWFAGVLADTAEPDLVLDRSRPAIAGRRPGGTVRTALSPARTTALALTAAGAGTTPATVFLAALAMVIGSGQRRFTLGVIADGRTGSRQPETVACLARTVPVPVETRAGDDAGAILDRCRNSLLAALARDRVPLAAIAQRLRRDGRMLQLRVSLAFDPEAVTSDPAKLISCDVAGQVDWCEPGVTVVPVEADGAQRDLAVSVFPGRHGREVRWHYDASLLDRASVELTSQRLLAALDLLTGGTAAPLPSPSAAGEQLGAGLSGPAQPLPDEDLTTEIARTVAGRPDAVLLCDTDPRCPRQLSARFAWQMSGRLAAGLLRAGVGVEDRVGVAVAGTVLGPVVLLAILRAGAAYVPLDPDAPAQRLAAQIGGAGLAAAVVLEPAAIHTGSGPDGVRQVLGAAGVPVLEVADLAGSQLAPSAGLPPDRAGCVTFTSGSSGAPKGVVVAHPALVNRLRWAQRGCPLSVGDRVLHKTPLGFDVSGWEWLWPLRVGACVVVPPSGSHRDPAAIARAVRQSGISVLHAVPSLLPALAEAAGPGGLRPLRHLLCSGESLPEASVAAIRSPGGFEIHNLYGPAEAAIDVTAWTVPRGSTKITIGRPIDNVRLRIEDPDGRQVLPGSPGELVIGGLAPARGYLGAPDLTAVAFVPDPDGPPGSRGYRTGDQVRIDREGWLHFLGRHDDQVKLHGQRLELGEIEAALRSAAGATEAAALLIGNGARSRLVGWVGGAPPGGLEPIRRRLAEMLPAALMPSQVRLLAKLPRLSSGKVDRALLASQLAGATVGGSDTHTAHEAAHRGDAVADPESDRAPAGAAGLGVTEAILLKAFQRVLPPGDIGPDTDFHAAGGDSIMAMRAVGLARRAGLPVELADLLRWPRARALAGHLLPPPAAHTEAQLPTEPAPVAPFALIDPEVRARLPGGVIDAYPISAAQQVMLYHSAHSGTAETYVTVLELAGQLNPERIRAAIRELAASHPYLRSSLHAARFGQPLQVVWEAPRGELLSIEPSADRDRWLAATRRTLIDPERQPLVRFALLPGPGEEVGLAVISFALDGWTAAGLLTELLFRQAGQLPQDWSTPTVSQADFVMLEAAASRDPGHRAFWSDLLAGAPVTQLPLWPVPPPGPVRLQQRVTVPVPEQLSQLLTTLAAQQGVPVRVVLLALHAVAIGSVTGQDAVTLGMGVNGRPEHPDGDRVAGVFNNIVPFPIRLAGRCWRELISTAADLDARIAGFARYPTAQLRRLDGRRDRYFSLFKFTRFRPYADLQRLPGLRVIGGLSPDQTHLPVTVFANVHPLTGEWEFLLDFDPALVPAAAAQLVADRHLQALATLVTDPGARPDDVDWARTSPARPVTAPGRATGPAPAVRPPAPLLPGQLLAALASRPDTVVLADDAGQLTAAALLSQVRAIAGTLLERGAAPGTVIGVQAGRNRDLVIAWAAVLVTGAALLPLDPADPPARTAGMLTAAAALLLLTGAGCTSTGTGSGALSSAGARGPLPCPVLDVRTCTGPLITRAATVHPMHPAWIIFTSGSTGDPKGVLIDQAAAVRYLDSAVASYGAGRTLMHTSPAVDFSVTTILVPLLAGGCVRISAAGDAESLAALLAREPVDILKLTPSHLNVLSALGVPRLPSRLLLSGGEALTRRQLTDPWIRTCARVMNEYGPTEATVGCTSHEVTPGDGAAIPIGRPLPGLSAKVVRRHRDVGRWSPGELWIGGEQVGGGYLNAPGATAEAFVPDPDRPGRRAYRTGDLVLADGADVLHFRGRVDRQLNLRGHRVEPSEVEAALSAIDGVAQAVVCGQDRGGRITLAAYLVPAAGAVLDLASVRVALTHRLPAHMVPDVLRLVDRLPLSGAGKVDVAALGALPMRPDPDRSDAALLDWVEELSDEKVERLLNSLHPLPDTGSGRP